MQCIEVSGLQFQNSLIEIPRLREPSLLMGRQALLEQRTCCVFQWLVWLLTDSHAGHRCVGGRPA